MLWLIPVPAGSSSRMGHWGPAIVPCKWAREPGWSSCLLSTCRCNTNNGSYQFLGPWVFPSAFAELLRFPNILYVVSLAFRAEVIQLAQSCLSREIVNTDTIPCFLVRELGHCPPAPPYWTHLLGHTNLMNKTTSTAPQHSWRSHNILIGSFKWFDWDVVGKVEKRRWLWWSRRKLGKLRLYWIWTHR